MIDSLSLKLASRYMFGFNGMEKDNEAKGLGNSYTTEFRQYDPRLGRWKSLDPLAYQFPHQTPYAGMDNNPTFLNDVFGLSTEVTKNEDGTYKVVGGNLDDDDKGIYVLGNDGKRTGEKLGESLTMYSFYNEDEQDGEEQTGWVGTIDISSTEAKDLVASFVKIADGISLIDYMANATDGEKYDFKRDGDPENNDRNFHHRGSLWETKKDGTKVFGTARDAGNYSAGYIAGLKNLSWTEARVGFDALEIAKSLSKGYFVTGEGKQSTLAQRLGHNVGYPIGHARWVAKEIEKAKSPWQIGPHF